MRRLLQIFPALIAALVLSAFAVEGGLTLLRPVLEPALPALYRPGTKPLLGMQVTQPHIALALPALFGGTYQKSAEADLNGALFQRPVLVRAFNQAQWDLFGTSYMADGSLVRGRGGTLFEESYIEAYCNRRQGVSDADLQTFARRLRAAQDWFTARGQKFVYVMAPTKTTWFPETIPDSYGCRSHPYDLVHAPAAQALTAAGVNWIDGRSLLLAAKPHWALPMFPRNGIHWNGLGQALAVQALIDKLRAQGMTGLQPLKWSLSAGADEVGLERDLAELLNLWRPPPAPPSPVVAIQPQTPPSPLVLAAVNDSFFDPMALMLTQAHAFDRVHDYGYVTLSQLEYHDGAAAPIHVDLAGITRDLTHADAVVLEEVESRPASGLASQFLDLIEQARRADPDGVRR